MEWECVAHRVQHKAYTWEVECGTYAEVAEVSLDGDKPIRACPLCGNDVEKETDHE